jgi:recombinational DNA repair ATPase RecF
MAELDTSRRSDLLKYVSPEAQALFTTTDLTLFAPEFFASAEIWDVKGGVVAPRK